LIFTNLSQDHLDYHVNMESYFQSKKKMFHLPRSKNSFCLLNYDDQYAMRLRAEIKGPCWTYGQEKGADFRFKIKDSSQSGTVFELQKSSSCYEFHLPFRGDYNVYNAVAALSCSLLTGFNEKDCAKALRTFPGVPGRLESVRQGLQDFEVLIDYAHTPKALSAVLQNLKPTASRIKLVVGCGGDRDKDKRSQMADVALQFADQIFWTNDNPRFEDPQQIVKEALNHLNEGERKKITVELDRKKAIQKAIQSAHKGDLVLIAGKGHEQFQIVRDKKFPFCDREIALQFLKN